MKWDKFEKKYPKGSKELNGLNPDTVYDDYYELVHPYLDVIAEFMSRDVPATEMQLKYAFGVSGKKWNVFKNVFPELDEYLGCKVSFMNFKSEIDLQKGLKNTEYKNPKILEMNLQMYNEDYRNRKSADTEVVLPKTIEVVVQDYTMSDEELEDVIGE